MTDDPSDPPPPNQPPPNRSPWESPPPDQPPFQRPPSYPPTPFQPPYQLPQPPPYQSPNEQQPYGPPPPYQSPYVPPHQPSPYDPASYQQQPYGTQYWQGQPANAGTNGLAIAALVLGIVWVFWIGSALAVIFGHIALGQIKRTGQRGHGMALAGLILGYIGGAAVLVLVIAFAIVAGEPA
jgi:Domain of unknown function (DUF4190)